MINIDNLNSESAKIYALLEASLKSLGEKVIIEIDFETGESIRGFETFDAILEKTVKPIPLKDIRGMLEHFLNNVNAINI